MYLHLGQNEIVPDHRIIGIFDLDKCSYEKRTREYLTRAEKEISLEKDKARDDMKQEMVQIASAMAGKFVSQSMTEEMQAQLIDETLEEMGDETWQK